MVKLLAFLLILASGLRGQDVVAVNRIEYGPAVALRVTLEGPQTFLAPPGGQRAHLVCTVYHGPCQGSCRWIDGKWVPGPKWCDEESPTEKWRINELRYDELIYDPEGYWPDTRSSRVDSPPPPLGSTAETPKTPRESGWLW